MNKKLLIAILLLGLFLPCRVYAGNTYVINNKAAGNACTIRTQPNEGGEYLPGKIAYLDPGDLITLIDGISPVKSTNSKCSSKYYAVLYSGAKGYVCEDFINFNSSGKYDQEFQSLGFPQSYWLSLNSLKERHPNWKFTPYFTNIDWQEAITSESAVEYNSNSGKYWSRSYIQSSDPLYLSKAAGVYNSATGTYTQLEAGGWYAANKSIVAYYMDPRNFLNDRDIFMFEEGTSNQTRQTKEVLNALFSSNAHAPYVNDFYEAATAGGNNINSVMIGVRSRLEVGGTTSLSNAANGSRGSYNFFNIGAFSSCENPVACGDNFAQGKGWRDPRTAIIGGASFIYTHYVKLEQRNIYFQKFNTTKNGNKYANQYMTNIEAPRTEANMMYKAYNSSNKMDVATEFYIPVYNNLPDSISGLPTTEEETPNTSNPETGDTTYVDIPSTITKAGYTISGNYMKGVSHGTTTAKLSENLRAKGNVTVSINGKAISTNQLIATGDTININNGNKTLSYQIVINGDTSGDGNISAADYVKVKNHIMGTHLSGVYALAADVNSDGKTSAADYVKIKNYIMGSGSI